MTHKAIDEIVVMAPIWSQEKLTQAIQEQVTLGKLEELSRLKSKSYKSHHKNNIWSITTLDIDERIKALQAELEATE